MRSWAAFRWVLLVLLLVGVLPAASSADTVTVTASRANVRAGPGVTHRVRTSVPQGATFSILATNQGWHQIRLDDGRNGWIAGSIVQVDRERRGLSIVKQSTTSAAPSRGIALVIGNAAYPLAPLRNPVNDASAMSTSLERLGFTVTRLLDADQRTMETAIRQFGRTLRQGGVGLFYYAGHGMQVGGANYLIPLDAALEEESDIRYEAVNVGRVLDALDEAGNALNIVILDACRNNPFARSWRRARGANEQGLAVVQAARGTLIAYATSPGSVAADGEGQNGLYTQHLLQQIQVPGLSVEHMFKRVRAGVMEETRGKQTPWESSSLTGDFSFAPATPTPLSTEVSEPKPPTPSTSSRPLSPDPEAEAWALIKDSMYPEDFQDFLAAYPSGRYRVAARLKLRQLQRQSEPGTPSVSPPQSAEVSRPPSSQPPGVQVAVGVYSQPPPPWPKTVRNSIGMEFMLIPAGEFMMGSNRGDSDEQPVHKVRISRPFFLGKYEVTLGQWKAVMGTNPSRFVDDNPELPTRFVSWENVQTFIRRLNAKEGESSYRLPTEAEWEYAARAGSTTAFSFGNDESRLGKYAWYRDNAGHRPHPVGQRQPNAWGFYDMYGNVWEWVQDWYRTYHDSYSDTPGTIVDPQGPSSGLLRIARGGGWSRTAEGCRSADRASLPEGSRSDSLGFRLLRTAP